MRFVLLGISTLCLLAMLRIDFLWLEALLNAAALGLAWLLKSRYSISPRPPTLLAPLRRIARRRPVLACAIPAVVATALRLSLLPWIPSPNPVIPDEYSHLFLAKTLLLGRLANPPHPMWKHFETIHILSQPTYSSMYLAGQATFLAAGKLLTGEWFGGVLLGTACFCAALTWFLRAYVPPGWALYGGVLAAVRFGTASYWNDSYWGGSVPAFGSALVLGAYPRLVRRLGFGPAIAATSGAIILINTRPWEGSGLLAIIGVGLLWSMIRKPSTVLCTRFAAVALMSAALFALAGWAMTRQFEAVTGNSVTLPYQVNQQMYGWPMTLPWFHPGTVAYRHPELAKYRSYEESEHAYITKPHLLLFGVLRKISLLWRFYFGVGLSLTFLAVPSLLKTRRLRIMWLAGVAVAIQVAIAQTGSPHYLAPAAPAIVLFIVQGLRHVNRQLPTLIWTAAPLMLTLIVVRSLSGIVGGEVNVNSWCCTDNRMYDRAAVVQRLGSEPGRHLVLVRTRSKEYASFDWVYNDPVIDDSRIVFARDMSSEQNHELIRYYPDRRVWKVAVDEEGWKCSELSASNILPAQTN